MYYFYVWKQWDYNNSPGHDTSHATQGGAFGTGGHAAASVVAVGDEKD